MANKTINEISNVSTQANDNDLLVMWDAAREKTVKIKDSDFNKGNQPKTLETPIEVDNVEETTVEGALGAINDKVKNFTAGVAFDGTRSDYNTAKLIPEGSDGFIPSGSLVIISDEGKTYITSGTGSGQTLELVANATFNGTHAQWNNLTSAQKAMYNIVNFTDDEGVKLSKARNIYHQDNIYVWDCYTHYVVSVTGATITQIQSFINSVSYKPSYVLQGLLSRRESNNNDVRIATFTITPEGIIGSWYADSNGTENALASTDIVYGQFVLPIEEK